MGWINLLNCTISRIDPTETNNLATENPGKTERIGKNVFGLERGVARVLNILKIELVTKCDRFKIQQH
jgi:hypothetical protein